jgi:hypothetical protein
LDIKQLKKEFDALRSDRRAWDSMFQLLGKYISLIKQNFEVTQQAGDFLLDDVYDATGTFAAHNSASALIGMLWPGTAKQAIEIVPPRDMTITTELQEFYTEMTHKVIAAMDDPRANLALSLDEYMLDQMIFGTSGVGVEKGYASKLLYRPYGVKELYIEEGRDGQVESAYLFFDWSVGRIIAEYGEDKVSKKIREKYQNGKTTDKAKILICIKPRREKKAKKGMLAAPYASYHLEWDTDHLLKESGFEEMPIMVGRFRKLNYEIYGRSPGSMALPDIKEANSLREAVIVATEKILSMPKGVMNDGIFGGSTIDMSSGAINVFNSTGNVSNQPPIFDIGSPPNLPWAEQRLEKLEQTIAQHFSVDRLLDFNSSQEMTFGEAQIRNQIRHQSLSSLFSRQLSEVITPLIERSVKILFRAGEFGVVRGTEEERDLLESGTAEIKYVPDEIADRLERGEEVYHLVYKTQAANASRAEEYLGIMDVMNFAINGMSVDPTLADRINLHAAVKHVTNIRGIPADIIRENDAVEQIAKGRQEQEQLMQGMAMASEAAGATKDLAVANKAKAEAQGAQAV